MITSLFNKSKIKNGFKPPVTRTKEQVDADYSREAILLGHKLRMAYQGLADVWGHLQNLVKINEEGMKLPKEEAKKQETAQNTPKEDSKVEAQAESKS